MAFKRLDCLVYLYEPIQNRRRGDLIKTARRFELLCGPDYASKLAMVTTMWDKISRLSHSERTACERREKALIQEWDAVMVHESKKGRFYASEKGGAWDLVDQVLLANGQLQVSEIVDLPSFRLASGLSLRELSLVRDILKNDLGIDLSAPASRISSYVGVPLASRNYSPPTYTIFFSIFANPSIIPKLVLLRTEKAQAMQNLLDEVSTS